MRTIWAVGLALAFIHGFGQGVTAEERNFQVYGARSQTERSNLTTRCQEIRDTLHARWNGDAKQQAWSPPCEIVLHASKSAYLAAVGAGGRGTVGATYIQCDPRDATRIIRRRVDLLTEGQSDPLAALPHELTHVLLADRYRGQQPPPWLDEGIATLADTAVKQKRHLLDLRNAVMRGQSLSIVTTLSIDGHVPSHQRGCFYGQSVALATILTRLDDPQRIFEFAHVARQQGAEQALRKIYKLELADLDRRIAKLALESDLALLE